MTSDDPARIINELPKMYILVHTVALAQISPFPRFFCVRKNPFEAHSSRDNSHKGKKCSMPRVLGDVRLHVDELSIEILRY